MIPGEFANGIGWQSSVDLTVLRKSLKCQCIAACQRWHVQHDGAMHSGNIMATL
jgi:hypothetical protein